MRGEMVSQGLSNVVGALALAITDRIDAAARDVTGRGGETPAALVVIGYGRGMTNDALRRILGRSHSGTVRLVDRLVADGLVERRKGRNAREVALRLTGSGERTRRALMTSRLGVIGALLDVLTPDEAGALETLVRTLLERQQTTEADRFAICRMCDNGVCGDCPLPTSVGGDLSRGEHR